MTAAASQNPRYEVHENPPFPAVVGYGLQFSLIASATLLVTPVIVAKDSGRDDSYLVWMVFASLLVVGVSTLLQARRLGPVGGGAALPMFTAAFSIPFCITAVVDGGPATLTTLVLITAVSQLVISKWLFILRRVVTPTVGGTVMMILSITLASVVFSLLDEATETEAGAPLLAALATLTIVAALMLRGSAALRLWGPVIGIAGGCVVAAVLGIYDFDRVVQAPWVGFPATARLQTWSSSAEETRRILRTRSGSSSSTTRRLLRSRTSRSGCCEATPLRCGISSTTIPTSSRSTSAHPGRDR